MYINMMQQQIKELINFLIWKVLIGFINHISNFH